MVDCWNATAAAKAVRYRPLNVSALRHPVGPIGVSNNKWVVLWWLLLLLVVVVVVVVVVAALPLL